MIAVGHDDLVVNDPVEYGRSTALQPWRCPDESPTIAAGWLGVHHSAPSGVLLTSLSRVSSKFYVDIYRAHVAALAFLGRSSAIGYPAGVAPTIHPLYHPSAVSQGPASLTLHARPGLLTWRREQRGIIRDPGLSVVTVVPRYGWMTPVWHVIGDEAAKAWLMLPRDALAEWVFSSSAFPAAYPAIASYFAGLPAPTDIGAAVPVPGVPGFERIVRQGTKFTDIRRWVILESLWAWAYTVIGSVARSVSCPPDVLVLPTTGGVCFFTTPATLDPVCHALNTRSQSHLPDDVHWSPAGTSWGDAINPWV